MVWWKLSDELVLHLGSYFSSDNERGGCGWRGSVNNVNRSRALGNMVAAMPQRVAMCLERKGAMTEY